MEKKVGVIVQARLGSERLPGKILLQACNKPFLELLLERLSGLNPIVATTTLDRDLPIVELCEKLKVPVYRGSEQDVLERTYRAAKENGLKTIIRITSDCPLADPEMISNYLQLFEEEDVDYLTNTLERTFPRGMDVEIFTFKALEAAWKEAQEPFDREHVTPYIRHHWGRFKPFSITQKEDASSIRLTLDTPDDYKLLKAIFEELYPKKKNFDYQDILQTLKEHPDWIEWNHHVKQKS